MLYDTPAVLQHIVFSKKENSGIEKKKKTLTPKWNAWEDVKAQTQQTVQKLGKLAEILSRLFCTAPFIQVEGLLGDAICMLNKPLTAQVY